MSSCGGPEVVRLRGETPYEQTTEIVRKLEYELGRAGASLADVVQTRVYVTDISRAEEIGRATPMLSAISRHL